MEVREEIEARTGRPVSYRAVHTTLDRLEAEGCASSRVGGVTRERVGRARKDFRVGPVGGEVSWVYQAVSLVGAVFF